MIFIRVEVSVRCLEIRVQVKCLNKHNILKDLSQIVVRDFDCEQKV